MISTQRLLMIAIGINLVIGLAGAIWINPVLYDSDEVTVQKALLEQYGTQFDEDDEYSGVQNNDVLSDSTIGNSLSWGKIMLDVFKMGANPFSLNKNNYDTSIEQIMAEFLMIFRSLMYVLLIIEVIMFIKNRKTS